MRLTSPGLQTIETQLSFNSTEIRHDARNLVTTTVEAAGLTIFSIIRTAGVETTNDLAEVMMVQTRVHADYRSSENCAACQRVCLTVERGSKPETSSNKGGADDKNKN